MEDRHFVTSGEESLNDLQANKTRSSKDQQPHVPIIATSRFASTSRAKIRNCRSVL